MAINKIPKNYYSDTNIRRDKINEIINEVNDIASIPSPSAADAGKIIKVGEDGAYELGTEASGSTIKIYDVKVSGNDYTLANGKTYNDILNDINNNNIVYIRRYKREIFTLSSIPVENVTDVIRFTLTDTNGAALQVETISITINNRVTIQGKSVS